MSGRFVVRRRIWAYDLLARRRRRTNAERFEHGVWDLLILGVVLTAIWHGLVLLVEAVTLLLLTAGQVLARLVVRQGWPVEARFRSNGALYRTWTATGFRAAQAAAADLQARADRGEPLPPPGPLQRLR